MTLKPKYVSVADHQRCHELHQIRQILFPRLKKKLMGEMLFCTKTRKKTISTLSDKFFEEQAFPYLLPKGKCGYNTSRDLQLSPV